MEILLIVSGIFILVLILKLTIANARLSGYQEALQFVQPQQPYYGNQANGIGCGGILAVIGFLAICALLITWVIP